MPDLILPSASYCYAIKSGLALVSPSVGEITTNPKLMCVDAVISTPARDRQGEILEPEGLLLDAEWPDRGPADYWRNPVVQYDHRASWPLPIGLAEDADGQCTVRKSGDTWRSTNYFSQSCKFAENVFRLMDEGIIRGWSVGFAPVEGTPIGMRPDRPNVKAYRYTRWKLVEQSATPTPQNPEALTVYVQKSKPGVLHPRLVDSLKPYMKPASATMLIPNSPVLPMGVKSMDIDPDTLPDGAADPNADDPQADETRGKKPPPSARKAMDVLQQIGDLMLSAGDGWDELEHEGMEDAMGEAIDGLETIRQHLSECMSDYHPDVEMDLPKIENKLGERKNKPEPEGEKADEAVDGGGATDETGKKKPKKDKEPDDYESRFKKSIVTVAPGEKGYRYVPQRLVRVDFVPKSESRKPTPEEEAEAQVELERLERLERRQRRQARANERSRARLRVG